MLAVYGCLAEDSAQTVTLSRSEVGSLVQRDFLPYDLRWKDLSYVNGRRMSIAQQDGRIAAAVRHLLKIEKCEEHYQKGHGNT